MRGALETVGVLAASAFLSGCVKLQVTKVNPAHPDHVVGWEYALPFAQFEFVAARTFAGCDANGRIKINYTVTATGTNVPDSSQTYLINYRSLSSVTKISDIKVSMYPNGMLQSVNGSAEDRTGAIIVNTVTALGNIAATVASGGARIPSPSPPPKGATRIHPPPLPPPGSVAGEIPCKDTIKPKVYRALEKEEGLDARLSKATAKLKAASARLALLTNTASAMGGHLDRTTQARLLQAVSDVSAATEAQTAAAKAAADNQNVLTDTQDFRMPATGAVDSDGAVTALIPTGPDLDSRWTSPPIKPAWFTVAVRLELIKGTQIPPPAMPSAAGSAPSGQASVSSPPGAGTGSSTPSGIVYRTPGRGRIVLCRMSTGLHKEQAKGVPLCNGPPSQGPILPSDTVALWEGPVPQFGRLLYLPYSNGVFENDLVSATFNQDGSLQAAEYEAKSSAEAATQSLLQASTAAQTAAQAVVQARLARLNLQGAVATAQNNLATAIGNSNAINVNTQLAQVTAQNNLVSAQSASTVAQQIGLIQANQALANAQAAYNNSQAALQASQHTLQAASSP